jgi:hypothetical protein
MAPRLNIKGVPLLPLWDSIPRLGRTLPFPFTNPVQTGTAIDNGYKLYGYTNVSTNTKFMVDARGKMEETAK